MELILFEEKCLLHFSTKHAGHEEVVDEHAGHNHAPGEHVDHPPVTTEEAVGGGKSIGMKAVDVAGQKSIETKVESITKEKKND